MKKETSFELAIPQNTKTKEEIKKEKNEHIKTLKEIIKIQYEEVYKKQDIKIKQENRYELESLMFATQDLIDNCIRDAYYNVNQDENFVSLIYICHKLDLEIKTYDLEIKMKQLQETSKQIEEKQEQAEKQNNNLVYNLLGFLTSFSIVSGVVGAIGNIKGIINIMIFMVFTIFVLLTTLIGLHNFYKNNNKRETIFQDNYFLWKITGGILLILVIATGIKYVEENKTNIFNYMDNKIEQVLDKKIEEKINNNQKRTNRSLFCI